MIYQYPIFRSDPASEESAAKYLAKNMIESGVIKIMEIDKDFYHKNLNKEDENKIFNFLHQTIIDMCYFMYGRNLTRMANFLIVSKMVNDKLIPSLTKYMDNIGLEYKLINFTPSEIVHPYIASKTKNPLFKPLERWDPNSIWDFNNNNLSPDEALTNPINGFIHSTLYLKNIDNRKFLISLQKNGILSRKNILDNKWYFEELELKLLPYNTFNKVLNIANAIFKYY